MKLSAYFVHRKPCPKPASWLRMGSTCSSHRMPLVETLMHAPWLCHNASGYDFCACPLAALSG